MNNPANTHRDLSRLPLSGAAPGTAERERQVTMHQRAERIWAADHAVDEYMRTSGTRDYQKAFQHIQDTRPELFADVQEPAHGRAAANFNPFHDQLGRFTTSDGAADPHGLHQRAKRTRMINHAVDEYMRTSGTRNYQKAFSHVESTRPDLFAGLQEPAGPTTASHYRHERPAQRRSGEASGQAKEAGAGRYDGKLTAGVYKEGIGDGDCLPAVMREAIAAISKLQTDAVRAKLIAQGAERYPDHSLQVGLRQLEQGIRTAHPERIFNFSTSDGGADAEEGKSTLEAYGVAFQKIPIEQIQNHLNEGPVLVAALDNGHPHAKLITSMNKDGTYNVYNPLVHGGRETIERKNIIVRGYPRVYALSPSKW